MSKPEMARQQRPTDSTPEPLEELLGGSDAALEERLARLSAELEQARFELALAARIRERLEREVAHLEQSVSELEDERVALRDDVKERDRIIGVIFESRSWKWMQALRRLLRRR